MCAVVEQPDHRCGDDLVFFRHWYFFCYRCSVNEHRVAYNNSEYLNPAWSLKSTITCAGILKWLSCSGLLRSVSRVQILQSRHLLIDFPIQCCGVAVVKPRQSSVPSMCRGSARSRVTPTTNRTSTTTTTSLTRHVTTRCHGNSQSNRLLGQDGCHGVRCCKKLHYKKLVTIASLASIDAVSKASRLNSNSVIVEYWKIYFGEFFSMMIKPHDGGLHSLLE